MDKKKKETQAQRNKRNRLFSEIEYLLVRGQSLLSDLDGGDGDEEWALDQLEKQKEEIEEYIFQKKSKRRKNR
jgi:hypothetical protein